MIMRKTTTNSGADSKGVVRFGRLELEGESYLIVVVAAVCSVAVFIAAYRLAFPLRACVALMPLAAGLLWIRYFVCGRPPHYLGDLLERLAVGPDFQVRLPRAARPSLLAKVEASS